MPEQHPLQVAVGVIKNAQDQVLLSLRHQHVHQGGLWEFPGGKIAADEKVLQALTRELQEELDIKIAAATPLITIRHTYADLSVQLNVLRIDRYSGQPHGREGQEIRWVALNALKTLRFPAANAPIITAAQLPDYYAIVDSATQRASAASALVAELLVSLQHLLNQGIKLIQARLKTLSVTQITQFLQQAIPLCGAFNAHLLLNSSLPDALEQAEGVHLTSAALMDLQQRPKHLRWLAASCHSLLQLQHAETIGVDFVVLAPVQKTLSHPEALPLGWQRFAALVAETNLPVYALGGLHQTDLEQAKQSGAQGVAGIRLFLA
ncbi:MAG: Nudix family hydrolase [Methylococcaceae bacterium]|nr:Nudix family hydrolase [Methylococcaceae bacterium]